MEDENYTAKFEFPADVETFFFENPTDLVCVVGIIGKHKLVSGVTKASRLNPLLKCEAFQAVQDTGEICLEGYYDAESHVIYLHLESLHDARSLVRLAEVVQKDELFWEKRECEAVRAMMMVFIVSHIILVAHPGSSFDVSYVRLFRILEDIRGKIQPAISDLLRSYGAPKEWAIAGRPCSPRVLFVFDQCLLRASELVGEEGDASEKLLKLQQKMEDQIYNILRKDRIITNISNNSLFAVPPNQEFVYVNCGPSERRDVVTVYLENLRSNCSTMREGDIPRTLSYQSMRRVNQTPGDRLASRGTRISTKSQPLLGVPSFKKFLMDHIDLALVKGFDDNIGRNPVPAIFELVPCELWFHYCSHLYTVLVELTAKESVGIMPHIKQLESDLTFNTRFSESRCQKLVPVAVNMYKEGLPTSYTLSFHKQKLEQVEQYLVHHARGPACQRFVQQLIQECEKIWTGGRQACEETSMTGHGCVQELHHTADDSLTDDDRPVLAHSSQYKTRATCNCGTIQADREDPFDLKVANFEFYETLEKQCCGQLEHFEVPVFKNLSKDAKAIVSRSSGIKKKEVDADKLSLSLGDSVERDFYDDTAVVNIYNSEASQDMLNQVIATSDDNENSDHADQRSTSPLDEATMEICPEVRGSRSSEEEEVEEVHIEQLSHNVCEDHTVTPQHSTTEYLVGMLHSEAPPGVLPVYPSWNLLCLGKASLYNPSVGVEQPNFSHQCNFLLPWDCHVINIKGPTAPEGKRTKFKKMTDGVGQETIYRLYLGCEYECPRGHRFFLSGPEKVFKAPPNGVFKEMAYKVVHADMPMYYPCSCRSSKGYMAQLMRIHVVLPNGPVRVNLHPRVCPAVDACPLFLLSTEGAITLPHDGWWILRLPYVYMGDAGPYLPPKDPQELVQCRILKDFITVSTTNG